MQRGSDISGTLQERAPISGGRNRLARTPTAKSVVGGFLIRYKRGLRYERVEGVCNTVLFHRSQECARLNTSTESCSSAVIRTARVMLLLLLLLLRCCYCCCCCCCAAGDDIADIGAAIVWLCVCCCRCSDVTGTAVEGTLALVKGFAETCVT